MKIRAIFVHFVYIILLLILGTLPFVFTSMNGNIIVQPEMIITSISQFISGLFDGTSFYYLNYNKEVFFFDMIGKLFIVSFLYITTALLLILVFSILFGIYLFRFTYKRLQPLLSIVSIVPDYILVLLLQFLVLTVLQKTGIQIAQVASFTMDKPAVALPLIVLFVFPFVYLSQSLNDVTSEVVTESYIRTARSKGLSRLQIYHYHVVTNVLPFLKSDLHKVISMMIGNLFIVEFLFNIKGITSLLFPMTNGFQYNLFILSFVSLFLLYTIVYMLSYGALHLFERMIGHSHSY